MSLLSYIFRREIYRSSSPYNTDICVIEKNSSLRLFVNGIEQSGGSIDSVLRRAYNACIFSSEIHTMLLLGVGGGSLISMIQKQFPDCHVDAVDIDSEIIKIAKTYFGFQHKRNVTWHISDAFAFVQHAVKKHDSAYDLIIIDLYVGRDIPEFVWNCSFLKYIQMLLAPKGSIFINVVHDERYINNMKKLVEILQSLFKRVQIHPIEYNTFFLATR
jgi:spermidine synthase